jgi:hypothetical protein
VRVNVGGEPDRDDFGLPPVDIEIPDDARELDRDVQAYHRELRARRRQMRIGRLHAPLTRDGLVLPLLAGGLAMVLISGVLLTVFTAGQSGGPRSTPSAPVSRASIRAPRATGGPAVPPERPGPGKLPDATVIIAGKSVRLHSLVPAVFTLVPARCQCAAELRHLTRQASAAGVSFYLVGTRKDMVQLGRLARRAGQPAANIADDQGGALAAFYRSHGLTAVLARGDGYVESVVRHPSKALRLTSRFQSLARTAP